MPEAEIEWRDGIVPVSTRFDDPYFSLQDGLAETRHVFLAGNDLPERFRDGFTIAELGFGTGLNFLATLQAWRTSGAPGSFRFTSFEAYPMRVETMMQALGVFPDVSEDARALAACWDELLSGHPVTIGAAELCLVTGDARATLPGWRDRADAWYLDGFSPAKNPELWEAPLIGAVAAHTAPGGTAASYTAAGAVRRALEAAGFEVTRAPGFGRKRHMTRARLRA
jgi:tRNA U34 5-methylaminomethyl-2-thiouridine-forming methyltransferase MnmC